MSTTEGIPTHLGFPKPLLGVRNTRLPILHKDDALLALSKPAGVLTTANSWYRRTPNLEDALNFQLEQGKGEFMRLGLNARNNLFSVFPLDPGVSGVALFAIGADASAYYRNLFGSGMMQLRFHFLARGNPEQDVIQCDLPVAKHFDEPRLVVSHTTGKQAATEFRRISAVGKYGLWEAVTSYYRVDQLPLHALEVGLKVLGDMRYAREYPLKLSRIKRDYRGDLEEELPLYEHPAMHLVEVSFQAEGGKPLVLSAPVEKRLSNLIRQISQNAGKAPRRVAETPEYE